VECRASRMNDAFLKVYFDKTRADLTARSASPPTARCMNRGAFYASASSKRGPAADRVGRAPGPPLNALPREGPIWPGCRPSRTAVPALRRAAAPAPSSPGFSGNGPACGRRRASLLQGSVGASCGQGIDSLPRRDPGGRRLRRTGVAGRGAGRLNPRAAPYAPRRPWATPWCVLGQGGLPGYPNGRGVAMGLRALAGLRRLISPYSAASAE
jgi:hypothetical protein